MNKYKTKYNKKCTTKTVTFYIKDIEILNFARSIIKRNERGIICK